MRWKCGWSRDVAEATRQARASDDKAETSRHRGPPFDQAIEPQTPQIGRPRKKSRDEAAAKETDSRPPTLAQVSLHVNKLAGGALYFKQGYQAHLQVKQQIF